MHVRRAVVGTHRLVLPRAPAKLAIGEHEAFFPQADFSERSLERQDALRQRLEEHCVRTGLILMSVKTS